MAEYAQRDIEELGVYYDGHVFAMTEEGLHEKSDLAAELAYRDKRFVDLVRAIVEAFGQHAICADSTFHISADAYNNIVRVANLEE